VFRLLPRKDAAATFEYLEQEAREALLKTLSKEDVAALLNNMAPDDRTMFLEELPATVTRELLALLTPQERADRGHAARLSRGSIGRLMTPDYVAVRESWTIQQVLDYVRTHGQDSETLNVIYVVDEHGVLIDDLRIREVLLADPVRRVSEIMDRHMVTLKATDDQQTAVAIFRQHDRSALPVTDTAGVLIGIVTVDDVLDVAETEATRDIQRIGGSEALDEPYMEIAFTRMIQKRAGWLTALFLGEMLTATAMGFFETEISARGGAGAVRAADHFERRQLRLAGLDAGHPRARARRGRADRLVARDAPRAWRGPRARHDSRRHRLPAHHRMVGLFRHLWSALDAGGDHGRVHAAGDRPLGDAGRIAAALRPAAPRLRSGGLVGAVRRDAGRRHRAGDLFFRRAVRAQGHTAVAARAGAIARYACYSAKL
jgi:CBS domain-containing protein